MTNKNALQIFSYEGNELRAVEDNGETWWAIIDVCRILDIKDVKQAASRLDDDEKQGYIMPTPGGDQMTACTNESGLYELMFTSRKPEAKKLKSWLKKDVIPSIRKTGFYDGSGQLAALQLQTARALVELAEEKTARIAELDSYTDSLLAIPHFEIDDGDRPTVARLIKRWLDLLREAEEKLAQIKKIVKREVTDMKIDSLEHTLKQSAVAANRMKALIEINNSLYDQTIPFFLQKQRTKEAIEEVSATIKALALPSDTKEVS